MPHSYQGQRLRLAKPRLVNPAFDTKAHRFTCDVNFGLVVDNNPNRVALIFSAEEATAIDLWLEPEIGGNGGLRITGGQNPWQLTYRDFGALVTREWYARGDATAPI